MKESFLIKASEIMDRDVFSADNYMVGRVVDLAVNPTSGLISHVVVNVKDNIELCRAFPYRSLAVREVDGFMKLFLKYTVDQVGSVPGMPLNDWVSVREATSIPVYNLTESRTGTMPSETYGMGDAGIGGHTSIEKNRKSDTDRLL
ncbi:hypothetical protein V6R21_12615 [Limibacter armeniacum]|uniref:PRC-barrel domain-containing protein n=1 Tax=Limibacter armeniacum TaxID=466084 RepID=UPI002FE5BB18